MEELFETMDKTLYRKYCTGPKTKSIVLDALCALRQTLWRYLKNELAFTFFESCLKLIKNYCSTYLHKGL